MFDVSKYGEVRLFLFKYFNIKAVISLPGTAFEPYAIFIRDFKA